VSEADKLDLATLADAAHFIGIHRASVGRLDTRHFCGRALRDHRHALGKPAVHADDALVAFFERIEHGGLDAAGA